MKKSQLIENNMIDVGLSESAWTELAVGIPMEMRFIHYARGTIGLMLRSRDGRKMVRIVLNKEKGKMDKHIDFEDQKLATVHGGFDSVEDEQSWLQYLDGLAATHEAEMLERMAADSAYEERKLERILNNDNF